MRNARVAFCLSFAILTVNTSSAQSVSDTHAGITRANYSSRARGPGIDKPSPQVLIDSKYLEVTGEYRKFLNWKDVSGDDPAIASHDAESNAYGISGEFGYRPWNNPLWIVLAAYYAAGLDTDMTLLNGEHVHGDVDDYGVGGGVRWTPYQTLKFAFFLWALGYYDFNDGEFDCGDIDCEYCNYVADCRAARRHSSLMGDYGLGVAFSVWRGVAITTGISYTGMFKSNNADENIRLKLGLLIPFGRRYPITE